MNNLIFALILAFLPKPATAPEKVYFTASDGVKVSAYMYKGVKTDPWVICFHQAGYSSGEYNEIAPDIVGKGFNCMVVDLRSGDRVNGVVNETAEVASAKGFNTSYLSAKNDMVAAVDFLLAKNDCKVILFGSSYSASLSLLMAAEDQRIFAVVAMSPGEYFKDELNLRSKILKLNKPALVTCSKEEVPATKALVAGLKTVTFYAPTTTGKHGASALWHSTPDREGYVMAVNSFLLGLKK